LKRGSILVYTLLMFALVTIFAISIVMSSSSITMQSVRHVDTVQKRKKEKLYANNFLQIGTSWYINESPSFSSCDATALSLLAQFMVDVQDDLIDGTLWLNVAQDASNNNMCVNLTTQLGPEIDTLTAMGALPNSEERQVYAFKLSQENYGGRVFIIAKAGSTFSWALGVRSGGGATSPFFSSLVHSESKLDLCAANNVHLDGPIEVAGGLNLENVHGNVTFDNVRVDGDVTITNGKNLTFYGDLEAKGNLLVTNKSNNIDFESEVAVEDLLRVERKSKNITFHSTVTLTQDPYISPDSEVDFDQGYQIENGLSVDPVATILQSFPVDEYFSSLESQAMELSDLWGNPPSEPAGIKVSGLAVVGFEYEKPMQRIGILDFDNLSYYELMYNPSSGPPYHSDLRKYSLFGYENKSFEFTGLIFGDELLALDTFAFIQSNNWMTLKGPLTLAAHDDIWIMQDVKYDFLPNNTNLWKSTAEMSTDTTLLTVVSKGNVNMMTRRIAGSFTSFLGKVNIWYKSDATIFGNIIESYSQQIDHNNLDLIFDPRLAEGNVTYVEHPGEYIDSGSTGGIDLR